MGRMAVYDLYDLLRTLDGPRRMAEVGVLYGNTSARLLGYLPDLSIIMVDPWREAAKDGPYAASGDVNARRTQEEWDAIYAQALAATERFKDRRRVLRMTSAEALLQVADGSLGLVFVDGDHSYESVKVDMGWYAKVRPGGILCGHDYAHRFSWSGVVRAVDEWVVEKGLVLNRKGQSVWWVRRPMEELP